ncbi:MAG TPA: zinc ABC transporter substrate-binding protein, partial [Methylomirabilota bacterium]
EPSAKETAKLLRTIRLEGVKAIFAESTVNPKLAAGLAREAGVKIVDDLYGDSLGPPGSGAETECGWRTPGRSRTRSSDHWARGCVVSGSRM